MGEHHPKVHGLGECTAEIGCGCILLRRSILLCLWVLRKQRVPTNAPAMELVALMKFALAILDGAQAEMLEEIVPSDSVLTN